MNTDNVSSRLGSTDLKVTRLGYGAARIDAIAPGQAEVLLNTLLDEGITFIDTADCYGDSEELIGRFLGNRMKECVLATKCGCLIVGETGEDYTGPVVANSIDRSLRRLGADPLDLVFIHSCSAAQLRNGGCTESLLAAKDAGKVRYTGYSGDGDDALAAIDMGVFDALQVTFNVVNQEALSEVLPDMPKVTISDQEAGRLGHGQALELEVDGQPGTIGAWTSAGRLVAVRVPGGPNRWNPKKVFPAEG